MNTIRPGISFATTHFNHLLILITLTIGLACLGTGFPGTALAEDNIGIFWDTDYVQDATVVNTFPGILTGYLVIKDPSTPFGIVGWELCADVTGPGQFISWTLAGDAVNVASPPCFAVGIGPGPLRSDRDVLLATFQIMVTEPSPVALSVRAPDSASVPDQMSYVPYNTNDLLPMTTLNGLPEVAFINDTNPHLAVDPRTLNFDDSPVGYETVQTVTVTNFGAAPGNVDIALAANGCDIFSLPGLSGPVTVPAGGSIEIPVACTPQTEESFSCNLTLGSELPDVQMVGNGWMATIAWEAPTELDFGGVATGASSILAITVHNVGDLEFILDPSITLPCPEFVIYSGGYPSMLQPGSQRTIYVEFSPTTVDTFSCYLDLGNVVPAVNLTGIGRSPLLNWSISPAALDFGPVAVGTTPEMAVTISNIGEGPIPIAPAMPDSCSQFSITGGGAPISLAPGANHTVTVQFSPLAEGVDYYCSLDLGELLEDIPLSGGGQVSVIDWTAPTSHDFGPVGLGQNESFTFAVSNTGNVGFQVDPSLVDNSQGFWLTSGASTLLDPGQSMSLTVMYQPLTEGLHSGVLDLGSTVPAVQLQGEGTPRQAAWTVSPNPLDFGWILIGSSRQETVVINNLGGTVLDLDISLARLDLGYSIVSGGGISQLGLAATHEVVVQFQPTIAGNFLTTLNLGPEVGSIPVTGWGQDPGDVCGIQPNALNFGPITVGNSQTKTFTVTNTGITYITVNPVSDSPEFISNGGARNLGPGQTVYYSVTYNPFMSGFHTGTIDLGNEFCIDLPLTGEATTVAGPGQDMVGIFFDPSFTSIEAQTFGPNEIVEGYLVLVEPSNSSGVGAWELSAGINGDAQWLNWTLEGQHINVGTYDDFIVGIGGSPLPFAPSIKLATFQILVAQPYPSVVYLELGPVQTPSIPGFMAWAPWDDPGNLLPMYPFTGEPVVAGINWGSPVGVGNPPPHAILTGGEVALEWPIPDNPGDGCHVYRRDETGSETRLTSQPVAGFGSTLNFTDRPTGYASGSVLYYSYTVVKSGVEGPRSPETEIKLTGIPVASTRLWPNVPNPFNPQTEIRFELSKPQQTRVVIYDVTGRLVKVLADGYLEAGPHARIWQGKDSSGRQVPSGAYYVRLVADGRVDHHKMMLLK